jgi:hypothetical protein
VRLFSVDGVASPIVRTISAAYSTTPPKKAEASAGNPDNWGTLIETVPECSQLDYEGGNVWCSPTSTTMIVSHWLGTDNCDLMPGAADAIYDWIYDGTGNWPFNTAYAATFGLEGSVRRLDSMEAIEDWVAQGVPVAISYAWGKGELTGAAVASSSGHLSVIVGFDIEGNPIVNDPAADRTQGEPVQRTYLRSELEPLWLQSSGGTVYLIHP